MVFASTVRLGLAAVILIVLLAAGVHFYILYKGMDAQPINLGERTELRERSCDFRPSSTVSVQCYWAHFDQPGLRYALPVVVMSLRGQRLAEDPLVYLAGGPGEGQVTSPDRLLFWEDWLHRTPIGRELVLLDTRGNKPAEPHWDCAAYTEVSQALLAQPLSLAEESARSLPVLQQCVTQYAQFLQQRAGPFTAIDDIHSLTNAADIAQVLQLLGYAEWNFLAVSYGTRVALQAAMRQPQVRRMILDSPYVHGTELPTTAAALWSAAFKRYFLWCKQTACSIQEAQFWQLMMQLREAPLPVTTQHWVADRAQSWLLNDGRLAAALYSAFYASELYRHIDPALVELRDGAPGEHADLLLTLFYNQVFDSSFNSMVFVATECNDGTVPTPDQYRAELADAGPWADYFAEDENLDICQSAAFAPGQLPPLAAIPVLTLVAAGGLDPVTPLSHAEHMMQFLPNGHLLRLPTSAHAEFFAGTCAEQWIPRFLNLPPEALPPHQPMPPCEPGAL